MVPWIIGALIGYAVEQHRTIRRQGVALIRAELRFEVLADAYGRSIDTYQEIIDGLTEELDNATGDDQLDAAGRADAKKHHPSYSAARGGIRRSTCITCGRDYPLGGSCPDYSIGVHPDNLFQLPLPTDR